MLKKKRKIHNQIFFRWKKEKERQETSKAYTDSGNVLSTKYSTPNPCLIKDEPFNQFRMHFISWYLKLQRTERTWEMRGNFLQEKSVNPKSWKPAGIEGLFWMKGFPMGSLGSCLWITALWRSKPRWVRKVIQQMSHLERKGIKQKLLTDCCKLKNYILLALGQPSSSRPMILRTY